MGINFGKGFFRICLIISFLGTPLVFVTSNVSVSKIEKERMKEKFFAGAINNQDEKKEYYISKLGKQAYAEIRRESIQELNKIIDEHMATDEIKKEVFYKAVFGSSTLCLLFLIVIWAIYFSMGFIVKGFASNKKE